jgi:polyferredoxin
MVLFGLGVLASFFVSRVYCGWICPINAAIKPFTWIKRRLKIKSINFSNNLTKPWVRYLVLAIFLGVFIFAIATEKKLPVLPALLAIGVILTIFFPEEIWHRYLCPYGTILSFTSAKAKYTMIIDEVKCNNCGICKRSCPAKAIEKTEKIHAIIPSDCLVCIECARKCDKNAINYI